MCKAAPPLRLNTKPYIIIDTYRDNRRCTVRRNHHAQAVWQRRTFDWNIQLRQASPCERLLPIETICIANVITVLFFDSALRLVSHFSPVVLNPCRISRSDDAVLLSVSPPKLLLRAWKPLC